ncbi:ATP-binding cassette domain-containing protein [Flavobacteriaceae bacterium]|jgi:phospholipid/cholesterol/gamma-HCH transport system ATP-binding protein|nr:ATP-binding cassette domain-containing protein [Flavobacteriaceae bacterium]
MIKVNNISKSFVKSQVISNISATFEKGKTNLIIGQSGSGKTVLMKCLLGLYDVDNGEIFFDEKKYDKDNISNMSNLRKQIGMVFQGSALFDSMTVLDNIMFPLRMFSSKTESEMISRAKEVIERVDLKDSDDKYPSEISGGMKKRVAIARAIVLNPKYLFCDEPNSGLDPKTAIIIDKLIQEITVEYNITTIINTHDMNSVMEIGDKIIFLVEGKKIWEGNNQEILNTDDKLINDFVYSSEIFKKVKLSQKKKS